MIACSSLLINEVMTCHGTLHTMPTNCRVLVVFLLIYGIRAQLVQHTPSNRCNNWIIIGCSVYPATWISYSWRVHRGGVSVEVIVFVLRIVSSWMDWRATRSTRWSCRIQEWFRFNTMCSWNKILQTSRQRILFTSGGFKTLASWDSKRIATHRCGHMTTKGSQRFVLYRLQWFAGQVSSDYPHPPSSSRHPKNTRTLRWTIRDSGCWALAVWSNFNDMEGDV